MKISRRDSIVFSTKAVAGLSLATIGLLRPAILTAQTPSNGLSSTTLPTLPVLPLTPDGSAIEYAPTKVAGISDVIWRTKSTPDTQFEYREMKIGLRGNGNVKLSGTLTFSDLEKLPRRRKLRCCSALRRTPVAL